MSVTVKLDPAVTPAALHIEGALTIAAVADARAALLLALQTLLDRPATPVRLDLSALDEIDGAGAQLLLALNAALGGAGHAPTVLGCPAAVQAVAHALGAADAEHLFGAAREGTTATLKEAA